MGNSLGLLSSGEVVPIQKPPNKLSTFIWPWNNGLATSNDILK